MAIKFHLISITPHRCTGNTLNIDTKAIKYLLETPMSLSLPIEFLHSQMMNAVKLDDLFRNLYVSIVLINVYCCSPQKQQAK